MRKYLNILIIIAISSVLNTLSAAEKLIYQINVQKEIGSTTWLYVKNGINEAVEKKSDIILIHMNTYGGELVYADSIRTKILDTKTPVYVFVDNNAASAGALIALSCDKIFMRSGGTIGAATVVNQTGAQMPDKYQSYMRAMMRSTAESHGKDTIVNGKDSVFRWKRDPRIAEAMVDDRIVIPGIIDSGRTLTFTTVEAIKNHYCEGEANNIHQVIDKYLHLQNYKLVVFRPSALDDIKGFLMSSIIQGILIMLIIGGIYFELQTPGIGFPLAVAVTAALLYFAPLYVDGLAANWEILVFIIGLILIALELFVIPGFGIAGILGITFVVAGLTLSLLNNSDFDFKPVHAPQISRALLTVFGGISFGFLLIIYLSSKIGTKGIFRKIALETTLDNQSGFIGVSMTAKELVGKEGVASTVLRLSGKVNIEGKVYDAVSEDGFIEKGTPVKVIRYETGQVYVEKSPE